jgi:hypothetical protein
LQPAIPPLRKAAAQHKEAKSNTLLGCGSLSRIGTNRAILEKLSRGIKIREDSRFAALVRPSDEGEPVQRWFRYREGYTAELCRKVFVRQESFVIDPFCGFGSTLVAAQRAGFPSAGLDVSPLAVFVSRVKTRRYSDSLVARIRTEMKALATIRADAPSSPPPQLRILNKLFHPEILNALSVFKCAIDGVADDHIRDFLRPQNSDAGVSARSTTWPFIAMGSIWPLPIWSGKNKYSQTQCRHF